MRLIDVSVFHFTCFLFPLLHREYILMGSSVCYIFFYLARLFNYILINNHTITTETDSERETHTLVRSKSKSRIRKKQTPTHTRIWNRTVKSLQHTHPPSVKSQLYADGLLRWCTHTASNTQWATCACTFFCCSSHSFNCWTIRWRKFSALTTVTW